MSDYIPPDPSVADSVNRTNAELRAIEERLEPLSDLELRSMLHGDEESRCRLVALGLLSRRLVKSNQDRDVRTTRLAELYGDLLNDPHPSIARAALQRCPLTEERHIEAARAALKHDDIEVRAAAAIALARIKDAQILVTLLQWLQGDDERFRYVAISALKWLGTEEARTTLVASYEQGGRSDGDRAVLAGALLELGDDRGVDFLADLAKRGEGAWSAVAATSLFLGANQRDDGLKLMLHILDHGDNDAKWHVVSQICYNWIHSPQAFTAEGVDEARCWIRKKLESPNKSLNPFKF